jgi:SagB-type dehydrogenase family enzyme
VPGELFIAGIGIALGYWHDDEKTAASFITHPRSGERLYRTGDLGRYLPDGNIEFMGREDFQVKIQGFRVELGDIEAALESHTSIRNAVVVAMGPDRGNKRLVGYVVPEGAAASTDELKSWLASKLPEYMVPGAFVVLDKLPLTANGKVDRNELPEPPSMETGGQAPSAVQSAPENSEVARIVGEILNADKLEADANLLKLGATSIEMIRIANALDQHLGFRPRMDEFYREPSIAGLSALLAKQQPQSVAADDTSGGDPLLTPAWLLDGIPKIMDPDERNQFKKSRPGLRQFESSADRLKLGVWESNETAYLQHRSYRDFSKAPLAIEVLGELLGQLSSIHLNSSPKYLYASAGGMYPVQCYLYIKPERVNGVAAGYYYHDPESNSLVRTAAQDDELRQLYDPIFNRPIFDQAAFAIFLVADLEAIGAMYQERALHYSALETGHITQILEMRAPTIGLGLCQTGGIETTDLQEQLALGEHHLVLHGLLGGGLPDPQATSNPVTDSTTTDERDEGEL